MMTRKIGLAVAVVSMLALVSAKATTYYVTNNVSSDYQPLASFHPGPLTVNVEQFHQGPYDELLKMKIAITGYEQADIKGENGSASAGSISASLSGDLWLTSVDFGNNPKVTFDYSSTSASVAANEGIAGGGAKAYNGSGSDFHDFGLQSASGSDITGWLYVADMNDPSMYIGSGTWGAKAKATGAWSITGTDDANTDVSGSSAKVDIQVIYAYTELIPEPGSVVLIGAGCCALYFRRRFQKLSKKA